MQKIKYFFIASMIFVSLSVYAQNNINSDSPFSRYGIGNITPPWLPQQNGMGGLSVAVGPLIGSAVNIINPASYSNIYMATIDAGMQMAYTQNSAQNGSSERKINGSLSYATFAFPVSSQTFKSGMSFGLVPYTRVGYSYFQNNTVGDVTTSNGNFGSGGINRIYTGYGAKIGENFSIGANLDYYFGNLDRSNTTEFANTGAISSKVENKTYVSGLGASYGAQFDVLVSQKTRLILGYAGKLNSQINFRNEQMATRFYRYADNSESPAIDTLFTNYASNKFKMPLENSFGLVLQEDNHWLIGADYRMANWSKSVYSNFDSQETYNNTWGISLGGQWIPNINAISGYFNRVEYRLGYLYENSYYHVNNQPVNFQKITAGFGFPLAPSRMGSYKLNVAFEYGNRGNLNQNGLKEQFFGLQLGFQLNDRWFQKVRFD